MRTDLEVNVGVIVLHSNGDSQLGEQNGGGCSKDDDCDDDDHEGGGDDQWTSIPANLHGERKGDGTAKTGPPHHELEPLVNLFLGLLGAQVDEQGEGVNVQGPGDHDGQLLFFRLMINILIPWGERKQSIAALRK